MPDRNETPEKSITLIDDRYGLPYSKGLMASTIMATGIPPRQAYEVARKVEDVLREANLHSISVDELRYLVHHLLREQAGDVYARRYLEWLALAKLKRPVIVLIGGTTGVGKSTIAAEVAHRLGITRLISTDSIREIMRSLFSEEFMPAIHESSFLAHTRLKFPLPHEVDPLILGFREQAEVVSVGVKAMMQRSIKEASHMVLEGVHIAPGFVDTNVDPERAVVVTTVVVAEKPEQHKSHFYIREIETQGYRAVEKYRSNFESIRKIGEYIEQLTAQYGYEKVSGLDIDRAVLRIIDIVMDRVASSPDVKETADDMERSSDAWKRRWDKWARARGKKAEEVGQ
jgi:2-phosphoglycerate kinase